MNGTYCSIGVFAQVSQWRLNSTAVEFENIEQRSPDPRVPVVERKQSEIGIGSRDETE